ncbi:MAG: hypothetical protein ACOVP5_03510 [Chitinophagales bacterium]
MRSNKRILWFISVSILLLNSLCGREIYLQPNIKNLSLGDCVPRKSDRPKNNTLKLKVFYLEEINKFLEYKKTFIIRMQPKESCPIPIAQFQLENKNKVETSLIITERPKRMSISEQTMKNEVGPGIMILSIIY